MLKNDKTVRIVLQMERIWKDFYDKIGTVEKLLNKFSFTKKKKVVFIGL